MKMNFSQKGFSLVELMVASALFMTVVAVAASAFISVLDASVQSREMNILMSNLDFALEDISRNIRVGENYSLVTGGIQFQVYATGSTTDKCTITYTLNSSERSIYKSKSTTPSSCNGYGSTAITSSEIDIETLNFTINEGMTTQPRVSINLSGVIRGEIKQDFTLQTSVTQRALDL